MMSVTPLILRVDAAANAALALVTVVALGPLTDAAGLSRGWPLAAIAAVLLVNGALCLLASRPSAITPRALRALADIDLLFVIGIGAVAVFDPTGAAGWLRAALAALVVIVAGVAIVKVLLAARVEARIGAA